MMASHIDVFQINKEIGFVHLSSLFDAFDNPPDAHY